MRYLNDWWHEKKAAAIAKSNEKQWVRRMRRRGFDSKIIEAMKRGLIGSGVTNSKLFGKYPKPLNVSRKFRRYW